MIKRYKSSNRMSQAVVHNNTLYLSGQVCAEGSDIAEQTTCTLDKVEALLNEFGSDKKHILSATIYIKDMALFSDMNEIWDKWTEEGFKPVRVCVEAQMARETLLFEISIIAALK